jgi:phage-related minor tail protein
MSDDIASLGLRVQSQEVDTANQRLDQLPQKARAASKATDALAASAAGSMGAIAKMVAQINTAVQEMAALQRAQAAQAQSATASAAATTAAAAAVQRASTISVQYSVSLNTTTAAAATNAAAVKAQGAAAAVAAAQNEAAASAAREMAEAIAQQNAALRGQGAGGVATGGSQASATNANAQAVMNLGKQTAIDAKEARKAAIAHANVTSVLGLTRTSATGAANAMGLTAFQMRQIAIQAPDVVQGLLSGQRPFQILIQQGGQVAQIMGMGPNGFGGALSAALKFLPGLLGFGAVAAVFGLVATAFMQGRKELADLNNALAVTNSYSGVTADNFEAMAHRIAAASDTTVKSSKSTVMALIQQGQFTGQTLTEAATYSAKFAELTGQDATKVVASFGAMRDGVTAFALKHVQAYHDLTQAQVDEIAKLEQEGKWHEAQMLFFREANGAIQKHATQYGLIEGAAHKVAEAASDMWDALLGIGKPKTQLQELQELLEKNATGMRLRGLGFGTSPGMSQGQVAGTVDQMAQFSFQQSLDRNKAREAQDVGDPLAAQSQATAQRAAIDQALASRAQAEAGLTVDIEKQADLQKQALRYQTAADQARLQQQIIDVHMDKALNAAQQSAIIGAMQRAAGINAQVNAERAQLIDARKHDDLIQEAVQIASAQIDQQMAALGLQRDLTTSIEARRQIDLRLQYLGDQKEAADAQAVLDSQLASKAQKAAAQAILDHLPDIHALRQQLIDQQALVDTIHQQAGVAQSALQNQVDILSSQADLAEFAGQRRAIERRVLDATQQIERSKALEAVWAAYAADDQVAVAKALANLKALTEVQANQARAFNGTGYSNFEDASRAMADVASAIGQNDWAKAAHDLMDALTNAAAILNDTSATFAQKAGAIAGVANGIGNLVGGQGGKAISGAASGAMLGMQIGSIIPGIGNVIGAIGGAIGGAIATFIGDGGKARRASEDKAAASIASALQSAEQQRYSQQQHQELTLAGLTGDALRETNVQRAQEVAGLDAANRARQQEIYKLQDQADIANKALDDAAQRMMGIHDAAKQASQSLAALYSSLTTGAAAMNSPQRQYLATKSNLVGVNTRVAAGDQSAFGDIQNSVSAFLQAAQARAPDKAAYNRDLAFAVQSVRDAKMAADSQVSIAQQQLDAAHAQVSSIQTVNDSVMTVTQAVQALQAALTGQAAVSAQAGALLGKTGASGGLAHFDTPDFTYFVDRNPDLKAQFQAGAGYARGRSEAAYGEIMFTTFGAGDRQFTPYGQAFAKGGAFTNGVVSSPTAFNMGLMGEAGSEAIMPLHKGPDGSLGVRMAANDNGGWAAVLTELQAIRAEMVTVRSQGAIGWAVVKRIFDLFRRITRDGEAVQTELKVPA